MEQRQLGRSGLMVSRLGLGTRTWGRDTDEHEAREMLTTFVDAGGTLVATDAGHGDGAAPALLGGLLARLVRRDELVVLAGGATAAPVGRRTVLAALDALLRELGVDHLDAWVVPPLLPGVPTDEVLGVLDQAVASGRVGYVVLGPSPGWQLAWAAAALASRPAGPLAGALAPYSLLDRSPEPEVLPAARTLGVGLLAASSLAGGVLTGKYRGVIPADSRAATRHLAATVTPHLDADGARVVEAVCTAADGLGVAPLEVALAWVRDRPGVSAALTAPRTAAQLRGVLTAEDLTLPVEIRDVLDEVSAG
jgi:aryl-alcohol dehydrogenase-like predicted oxidoreductase